LNAVAVRRRFTSEAVHAGALFSHDRRYDRLSERNEPLAVVPLSERVRDDGDADDQFTAGFLWAVRGPGQTE